MSLLLILASLVVVLFVVFVAGALRNTNTRDNPNIPTGRTAPVNRPVEHR